MRPNENNGEECESENSALDYLHRRCSSIGRQLGGPALHVGGALEVVDLQSRAYIEARRNLAYYLIYSYLLPG